MRTINPGDLNGDGHDDLLIAHSSADIGAGNSGAVFIYHTGPDGLGTEPVQVLSGTTIEEEFGRAAAVADVDRDGLPDLIAAARLSDPGVNDAGALFVYQGQPGGLSEAPMDVWLVFEEATNSVLPWRSAISTGMDFRILQAQPLPTKIGHNSRSP